MFNLAPIGMGRASFRLAEIIQLGRIPVYLYEDFPWSPYEDSGQLKLFIFFNCVILRCIVICIFVILRHSMLSYVLFYVMLLYMM